MKAKDTILDDEQLLRAGAYYINYAPLRNAIRVQAEISFKAGIKEVIGWVNDNVSWRPDAPYKSAIDMNEWKAKIQEWELL